MLELIFIAITFLAFLFFYLGTGKDRQVLIFSISWLSTVGLVAYSGFFENTSTSPPRFLVVLVVGVALSVWFYKLVGKNRLNTRLLLAIHVLRIPVELVLYQLYLREQLPEIMTFQGYNFDILIGLSAVAILLYGSVTHNPLSKSFVLIWNLIGLLFLTVIVVMAILSSPLPIQQFAFQQPNVAVLKFPYVFLPAYIVPIVYLSHLLTIDSYLE